MRIAILGGDDFDESALEDFLYKLHAKYPDSTIVTGGERGAEKEARVLLEAIGHAVESPPKRDFSGKPSDWQAYSCMSGDLTLVKDSEGRIQSHQLSPPADIIVAVGNPNSHRAKIALDHWKRMDSWRLPENQRQLVQVAVPKATKKKAAPRRAKKRTEQLAT